MDWLWSSWCNDMIGTIKNALASPSIHQYAYNTVNMHLTSPSIHQYVNTKLETHMWPLTSPPTHQYTFKIGNIHVTSPPILTLALFLQVALGTSTSIDQYVFDTRILFTHIGLLLAGGIGVAVADVLAIALLGRAVLLVSPWTLVILQTYWYSCVFWVGWKFWPFPHLLGNGFPSLSLVQWWRSARIASPPCCTRHNPCWG